jgi:hypothetical protein
LHGSFRFVVIAAIKIWIAGATASDQLEFIGGALGGRQKRTS